MAHAAIDGLSWEAAFVLGAIVAPTDPVSAAATFSRLGAPERVALTVEGEAMLNDAAALVAYRVAVTAVVAGSFQFGEAMLEFFASAAGGVAVGLAVGWLGLRIQRRLDDVPLAIFLTVLFAYGAYIGAEELRVSGVLGTVTAGVWFGWHSHEMFDADTRLNAMAFWQALVFGLEATLFVLLGLELESVVDALDSGLTPSELAFYIAAVSATVIGVRLAWQGLSPLIARAVPVARDADTGEDWRERLVVGWSGMRGAISLAAVLALPTTLDSGAAFAERDLLIFVTVGVIVVTLVGQGLTLPALMRVLGVEGERVWSPDEAIARLEAAQAALDRLDELELEDGLPEDRLRRLRELYQARFQRCVAILGGDDAEDRAAMRDPAARFGEVRRELIGVERATLLELRNAGGCVPTSCG